MKTYQYDNIKENVSEAIRNIAVSCKEMGAQKKHLDNNLRYVRKMLEYIADSCPENEKTTIEMFSLLGEIKIRIFYKGEKLNVGSLIHYCTIDGDEMMINEVEATKIRKIFANYYESSTFSHKYNENGVNMLTILVRKSSYKTLVVLMTSMALGIIAGLLIRKYVPESAGVFVADNLFSFVSSVFVNCVKMLIGPLMFFTIASSISSYSDLSSLGRMGGKLVTRYLLNALIALVVSVAVVLFLKPGVDASVPSVESFVAGSQAVAQTVSNNPVSIKDTLLGFFPSNFFKAFTDSSMMQIIFISFLLGLSTGFLNVEARESIHRFLSCGNELFCKMTNIIMIFLPISVFCSMANTMIVMGIDTLIMLFRWVIALIVAFVLMSAVYVLMTAFSAKISPMLFLRKYGEAITSTFAMGSCNSSMPNCISGIENKMGVSKHISSLTMPIGVSIHCASNCVFYLISAFFLANLYTGLEISPLAYPMIYFSILTLGIGAPSISGAGPICVAMLLPQLGVPMGLITLIIGLDPFISMFKSACSCIEDASVTLSVARSEGMINEEVLNS